MAQANLLISMPTSTKVVQCTVLTGCAHNSCVDAAVGAVQNLQNYYYCT